MEKIKRFYFHLICLQEVESICDRVIIINKGTIVADDTLVNLQSANKTSHIVVVQFGTNIDINLLKTLEGVDKGRNNI